MPELTQERVRELFNYNPSTGILKWKIRTSNRIKVGDVAGTLYPREYLSVQVNGESYLVHRVIWLFLYGYFPDEIDHINHKKSDNRQFNLRDVSRKENARNIKLYCSNSSGVTGVSFDRKARKWYAQIGVNRKVIPLGRFKDFDEAAAVRKHAEIKYGFHQHHGTP